MVAHDVLTRARQGNPEALGEVLNARLQAQLVPELFVQVHVAQDPAPVLHIQVDPDLAIGTLQPVDVLRILHRQLQELELPRWVEFVQIQGLLDGSVWHEQLFLHSQESRDPRELPIRVQEERQDLFIVCGLGQLGLQCMTALREFGVQIAAIDVDYPETWQTHGILEGLSEKQLILGDCRYEKVLLEAGIESCRSILLVTSDEGTNLEAAFTARKLNPHVRLVVRSSKHNLNQLLGPRLGNFVAYDPAQLSATAFSLAALGEQTVGAFSIDGCQLQVICRPVQSGDPFDRIPAYLMHKRSYRLLYHESAQAIQSGSVQTPFFRWSPNTLVEAGDIITVLERVDPRPLSAYRVEMSRHRTRSWWQLGGWQQVLAWDMAVIWQRSWQWCRASRIRQNSILAALITPTMGLLTSFLLKVHGELTWREAVSATVVLLLGGYGDIFGGLRLEASLPLWVQVICFATTVISLLFVLGVLSVIADNLLSAQFRFLEHRPTMPEQDHIIICGMGRVGREVAMFLRQRQQPMVGLTRDTDTGARDLPDIPLVTGSFFESLAQVNLKTARGMMALTDDQLLNVELSLMAQGLVDPSHPLNLVIRTTDSQFTDNLTRLLPEAKALSAYSLSAAAFAGAAFGENILGLFRLKGQTILVTEYLIEVDDTLHHRLLSQVAYGYGVVPIFYQRKSDVRAKHKDPAEFLMPINDIRLNVGDRLVVLATITGLRRIEQGELAGLSLWKLTVLNPMNRGVLFEAARVIHNVTGCSLQTAREFLEHLPGHMELKLYDHQAYDLWQRLNDMKQLPTRLERLNSGSSQRP